MWLGAAHVSRFKGHVHKGVQQLRVHADVEGCTFFDKFAESKFEKSFGLRRLELGSIRPQIIRVLIELVFFAWWYVCKRQNVWHVDSNYIV